MTVKRKKILAISLGLTAISVPIIGTGIYLGVEESKAQKVNIYNDFINNIINNNEVTPQEEYMVKGADVSSYADVIENFLFEKNIKKSENEWYTYKDIASNNYFTWDEKVNKDVTLLEYINNNLYSYYDSNSDLVYANMFEILHSKGFNSLRLKLWVDPYDENGNQYGGGHNDIETTIFIINEAKKYGFNDFLLNFHYSDFWADPGKQYFPKAWKNLSTDELIQKAYDYTYETLEYIYEKTGVLINRVQYGNEVNYGILVSKSNTDSANAIFNLASNFMLSAINATNDFSKKYNYQIDKNIHFANGNFDALVKKYKQVVDACDTIQISSYVIYGTSIDKQFDFLYNFTKNFPTKKLIIGEIALPFTSSDSGSLNDGAEGVVNKNKPDYFDYSPEIQALLMNQYMQLISKLFPNMKTGFYWWEIGYLHLGRSTWATKEGMEYLYLLDKSKYKDIHNWSALTCFDRNGIALPVLDVIKNFDRVSQNIISKPISEIVNVTNSDTNSANVFYKYINFVYTDDLQKYDLSKVCFNNEKQNANNENMDIDLNVHINKYNYQDYIDSYSFDTILKNIVLTELKNEFDSIMYDHTVISNFKYDSNDKIGEITLKATDNSIFYYGEVTFKFKVHDSYYQNTIDLTNMVIEIDKSHNEWYKDIINALKLQENWAFGKQIWDTFGIEGGASDDNNIWLWDPNKYTNRNAEFFLLDNDQIRLHNNKVDYDVLNEHKIWIDNFSKYNSGEHEIYFAIKKGLNDIDWEYDTPSTYSQVGKESWKYVDLLVYKLKINIS